MIKAGGTICAVLVLFALAGCGGDSDSSSGISYEPFNIPVDGKREIRYAEELKPKANGLVGSELKPVIPDRPPPEFLVQVDFIDGIGAPAYEGDRATVQYVGYLYDSKKKFASSWDEGKPFSFTLGKGEVIEGWEEGIEGMEVSDRRELVVPPDLATGGSRMKDIPADSTLVYVIDLLDVEEK
jgi:FKBP-type peptidyl-prolyl isomerase-like protein